jgi:hypothetical protein
VRVCVLQLCKTAEVKFISYVLRYPAERQVCRTHHQVIGLWKSLVPFPSSSRFSSMELQGRKVSCKLPFTPPRNMLECAVEAIPAHTSKRSAREPISNHVSKTDLNETDALMIGFLICESFRSHITHYRPSFVALISGSEDGI